MQQLIRPKTIVGKMRLFSLLFYLSSSTIILAQSKPTTAVARTLQTRTFPADTKTTLKASINALQDLDYTIDVLNSDVGLITASRTTEEKKANVSSDDNEVGPKSNSESNLNPEELAKEQQRDACLTIFGVVIVAAFFAILINAITGGGDDDDDDDDHDSGSSTRSLGRSNTRHKTVNNYYQNDKPKGPRIYRYKVTINIDDSGSENTTIRVSASGELEQDGKILESGGIHEPEFFKRFFASTEKSLFLDQNLPSN